MSGEDVRLKKEPQEVERKMKERCGVTHQKVNVGYVNKNRFRGTREKKIRCAALVRYDFTIPKKSATVGGGSVTQKRRKNEAGDDDAALNFPHQFVGTASARE